MLYTCSGLPYRSIHVSDQQKNGACVEMEGTKRDDEVEGWVILCSEYKFPALYTSKKVKRQDRNLNPWEVQS